MTDHYEWLDFLATNDTSRGGDCLTPADIEEQDARDRALKIIRKAAVSQQDEGGFLGAALRDRGILP